MKKARQLCGLFFDPKKTHDKDDYNITPNAMLSWHKFTDAPAPIGYC